MRSDQELLAAAEQLRDRFQEKATRTTPFSWIDMSAYTTLAFRLIPPQGSSLPDRELSLSRRIAYAAEDMEFEAWTCRDYPYTTQHFLEAAAAIRALLSPSSEEKDAHD